MYAGIPMELARDGKLSFLARSVAMYVWSHDEKWQQSASAVAADLGMDRGTVGKALAELQEHGWMVREIHQTVGPSGKPRTAWERWHLQMTNQRFTSEEIQELSIPSDVRATPAPSIQTCGPHPHGGAGDTSTGGVDDTRTIEMDSRNAPEVHSSNASNDQETPPGSLAIAGSEPATEEHRPVGLQPASAGSTATPEAWPYEDPFSQPPIWLAESRQQEARAAEYLEPATAGALPAPAWD